MKLLNRTTLYYAVISTCVFLVGGIITYFAVLSLIDKDANQFFSRYEERMMDRIKKGELKLDSLPRFSSLSVKKLNKLGSQTPHYQDTTFKFDKWEMRFRKKTFNKQINGKYYQISVLKSMEEANTGIEAVLFTILGLFVASMVVLVVFNYFIARRIWQPFNHTLQEIKNFDLHGKAKLDLQTTNIYEFNELNRLVGEMTDKIRKDYDNLKEFTENASHELQTPLAVIKTKLEILMDSPNLNEEQLKLIDSVYHSASKLSRLSKTLALLTRIENQEFSNIQTINFTQLLENNLYNFQELIDLKALDLTHNLVETSVKIDPSIGDVMVSNLLKNAIKHNFENGKIHILLNAQKLQIINTGKPLKTESKTLFERFQKDNPASDSIGLGLAIVKKICEVNQFTIVYEYIADLHQVTVYFNQSNPHPKSKPQLTI